MAAGQNACSVRRSACCSVQKAVMTIRTVVCSIALTAVLASSLPRNLVINGNATLTTGIQHWVSNRTSGYQCFVGGIENGLFGFRGPNRDATLPSSSPLYCKMHQDIRLVCNGNETLTVRASMIRSGGDFSTIVVTSVGRDGRNLSHVRLINVDDANSISSKEVTLLGTPSTYIVRVEFAAYVSGSGQYADAGASSIAVLLASGRRNCRPATSLSSTASEESSLTRTSSVSLSASVDSSLTQTSSFSLSAPVSCSLTRTSTSSVGLSKSYSNSEHSLTPSHTVTPAVSSTSSCSQAKRSFTFTYTWSFGTSPTHSRSVTRGPSGSASKHAKSSSSTLVAATPSHTLTADAAVAIPPLIPLEGVQATETAMVVFSSIAATAAASSVSSQVVLSVGQCTGHSSNDDANDPPAMYMVSPFWGTRSCRMVALGNPLLAGVVLSLQLLCCRCAAAVLGSTVTECRARLRWPHWSLIFATLMVQGTLLGSVRCMGYDANIADVVAGVVGLLLGGVLGMNFFVVRWHFAADVWLEPRVVVGRWQRVAFLLPSAEWMPRDTNSKYGASFSSMRKESVFWWPVVPQFVVPLVYAIVSGVRLPANVRHSVCDILLWGAAAVTFAAAVCCLWLRPYRCPLNSYAIACGFAVLGCSTVVYSNAVRSRFEDYTLRHATAVFAALQFTVAALTMLCMFLGRFALRVVSVDPGASLESELVDVGAFEAAEKNCDESNVIAVANGEDDEAPAFVYLECQAVTKSSLLSDIVDVQLGSGTLLQEFYDQAHSSTDKSLL